MIIFEFQVTGNNLRRTDVNKMVAVSRNNAAAKFNFNSDWDNVTPIVAQFSKDENTCYDAIIKNGECEVPWEVLESEGTLSVAVAGGDLITTNNIKINVYGSGLVGGLVHTTASPGLYGYLLEKVDGMDDEVVTGKVEANDIVVNDIEAGDITVGSILLNSDDESLRLNGSSITGNGNNTISDIYYIEAETINAINDMETGGNIHADGNIYCEDLNADGIVNAASFEGENINADKITVGSILLNSDEESLRLTGSSITGNGANTISNIYHIEAERLNGSNYIGSGGDIYAEGSVYCEDLNAGGIVNATSFEGENISLTKASIIPEIKNNFSTDTYNNVATDLKFSKSGFNLKAVSTKTSDGSIYTNEIKTSNSKITVNANDFEVSSVKNIKLNSDSTATINGNGIKIQNSGSDRIVTNSVYTQINGEGSSINVGGSNIVLNSNNDINISSKNVRTNLNGVGTYEVIGNTIDGDGSIVRLGVKGEGKTTKVYLGKDYAKIGVYNSSDNTFNSEMDNGIEVDKNKVNVLGDLYHNDEHIILKQDIDLVNTRINGIPKFAFAFRQDINKVAVSWTVEEGAFIGSSVTELDFSDVGNIGMEAFKDCVNLKKVIISENANSIGISAFEGCINLKTVTMPEDNSSNNFNVASIGDYAFKDCISLTGINIAKGCNSISDTAFQGCTNLKSIKINKAQDTITGAPWGAVNATVEWLG